MSKICINSVKSIISENNNLGYENLKSVFKELDVEIRELTDVTEVTEVTEVTDNYNELSDLYLLISKDTENPTPLQIECNGLVLEKKSNKIVCMCFNKFNKISNITNELENKNKKNMIRMEYCEDGTVIRLYNVGQKWYTATTKCIDARKSYWSSEKTYDSMFWEIFNKSGYNIDNLNINCTYSFIILHNDNRIVVNHKYNNLIYINSIDNDTQEENFTNYFYNENPNRCIRRMKQIDITTGIDNELENYYISDKRGILIKYFDQSTSIWNIYQYDFELYSNIKEIRGNVPKIRTRYLELLDDPEKLEILEREFPENKLLFAMIKHSINNLYKRVHKLYFESHVKHSLVVTDSDPLFRTLKQLHAQFKQKNKIVTFEVVIEKVNKLNPNIIGTLVGWVN